MSTEENKAITRRLFEGFWNEENEAVIDEVVAPTFVDHVGTGWTRDQYHDVWNQGRAAFPDCRVTVEDLVAEGDRVAGWVTFRGTHQGDYLGMPASGKSMSFSLFFVQRIAAGKVVENWGLFDIAGIQRQASE